MMKKIAIIILLFCVFTSKAQVEAPRYFIKNIEANSALSNFGTTFYGEDKLVYASPAKRNYIISNVWKGNDQPFLDLYVGTITDDGGIKDIEKFSNLVNTKFHEADVTFSKDKKTVYFTRSNYFEGKYKKDSLGINRLKIYKATQGADGNWSKTSNMPFNNDNYSVGHPTLSEDQKTLYFVSDMPGTLGKTDIFKVAVNENGTYGDPINLGPEINTPEKEMFPFIAGNDVLYFSSEGRGGFGMLDIFKSKLGSSGIEYTINLGEPINSDQDDLGFIVNKETMEGYFTSNRSDGKGDDDIYYFKEIICNQSVIGLVKDKETGLLLPGTTITVFKNNVKIDSLTTIVAADSKFEFPLECESSYKIVGNKQNYLEASVNVMTTKENEKVHEVTLYLEPDEEFVVVGDRVLIKLNNIYFDFDMSDIRPDAEIELKKAIDIMKKYPDIIVEFGAHCDSRGRDAYNDKLSTRRANSTVDYITSRGISTERLTGKGYGERMLVNKCANGVKCTEEEHQLNRRTEFVIQNPEVINNGQLLNNYDH
jgi:outer membrane protein OmpA-like peptidoglycan-associated protein